MQHKQGKWWERGRATRRSLSGIALFGSVALLAAGCTTGGSTDNGSISPGSKPLALATSTPAPSGDAACPTRGGTLTMSRDQDVNSLDPANSTGNNNLFAQAALFDELVILEPGYNEPKPGLASKYAISSDQKTYTFTLRPGIKFSDGSPITADDVVFNLKRATDPEQDQGFSFLYTNIASIDKVDDTTVAVSTKTVDASLLSTLALPPSGIYSSTVFKKLGAAAFNLNPVGSGAFMVKSWEQGSKLSIVKNPYYWKSGQPCLDGVDFNFVPQENSRILQLSSGETDIAQSIPYSQVKSLTGKSGYTIQLAPYAVMNSLWLNNDVKPLNDKKVRQALNYATPKDAINNAVLGGLGTAQNSMIGKSNFWDPKIKPYPLDVAKAKKLMASSSAPNGFTLPILITGGNNVQEQTAEILQSAYAEIGVKVEIKAGDSASVDQQFSSSNYSARLYSPSDISSDTPDSSEQAAIMLDGSLKDWNGFFTNYNNPEATKLVRAAVGTLDTAKRQKLYSELQQLGMDDAPQVALLFTPTVTGVSDKVKGFQTMINGWWRLEDVSLTK